MLKKALPLIIFFLILVCNEGFSQNSTQDPKEAAKSSYNVFKQTISGTGSIKQNYVNPLLGNVPLYTIDRSVSGNAQILCPSVNEFLTIIGQPAETGDVNFTIFWDTNRDGRMDHQISLNKVSGVCSNGFIVCNPGTWNNCTYYTFVSDGSNLWTRESGIKEMSGCFCINNYCGGNLFLRNAPYVLSVFGGGVISAFQNANPSFTASSAVVEDVSIKFYAQDVGSCASPGGSGTVRELSSYRETPLIMTNIATERFYSDINNPQSISYYVYRAAQQMEETSEIRECSINYVIQTRQYNLADIFSRNTDCFGNLPGPYTCGEKCLYFEFGMWQEYGSSNGYARIEFEMTPDFYPLIDTVKGYWSTDTTGPYPCLDDDGWVYFYINGNYAGGQSYGDSEWECGCCNGGVPHWVTLDKNYFIAPPARESVINVIEVRAGGMGGGEGVQAGCRPVKIYFYLNGPVKGCYVTDEHTDNTCTQYEGRSDCVLWDEIVDGVQTYQGGIKTGLQPLVKCEVICGEYVCKTGWNIQRRYRCKASGMDLTNAEKRLSHVYSTTVYDPSSGTLSFSDIRYQNESWTEYPGQQLKILPWETPEECEKVCRVISPVNVREVEANVGLRGPQNPRPSFVYKPCVKDDAGRDVCPLSEGETLDTDCTCASFFNEAVTALQAVRLAGSDFICSSGIEKSF